MQKFYPVIFLLMLCIIIGQYFYSDKRISDLKRLENEAKSTIAEVRKSEREAINRANSIEQRITDIKKSIGVSIVGTNKIQSRIIIAQGYVNESRKIIDELRGTIQ